MSRPQTRIDVYRKQKFSNGECPWCTAGIDYFFSGIIVTEGDDGSGNYSRKVWLELPIEIETRNDGVEITGKAQRNDVSVVIPLKNTAFTSLDVFRSFLMGAVSALAGDATGSMAYSIDGSRLRIWAGSVSDGDGSADGGDTGGDGQNSGCMIVRHLLENECGSIVTCSNVAPAFSMNAGVASFTIPSGTDVLRIELMGDDTKTDANGDLWVEITWDGSRGFNSGNCNMTLPIVVAWNRSSEPAGGPTETLPFTQTNMHQPVVQIVQVGSGASSYLKLRIVQIKQTYPVWGVAISLNG